MENLKKAENKNVESRGAKKRVGNAVRGASTFDIFIFGLFQENPLAHIPPSHTYCILTRDTFESITVKATDLGKRASVMHCDSGLFVLSRLSYVTRS